MLDSWFHSDDLLSALKLGYKWGHHKLVSEHRNRPRMWKLRSGCKWSYFSLGQ